MAMDEEKLVDDGVNVQVELEETQRALVDKEI